MNFAQSLVCCMHKPEKSKSLADGAAISVKEKQQGDYLEVFEKLVVNLQISTTDLKQWAI